MQWYQVDHMQTICTSLTVPTPHHSIFYRPDALPDAQPTVAKHWRHNTHLLRENYCRQHEMHWQYHIPFATIALTEYGHHAFDRAKDGAVNNDGTLLFTLLIATAATTQSLINNNNNNKTDCQQAHLCSSCHRVSQDLEPPSSGTSAGAGSTNDSRHWRHQGSNLPVPVDVSDSPTG